MLNRNLLPQHATFATLDVDESENDIRRLIDLHPLEQALVVNSVARRQAEFADGRWCAHQALGLQESFGATQPAILKGERGMPVWPEGFCGAISHTDGMRAAVVAPTSAISSIGLDCEPRASLPPEVLTSIARPAELARIVQLYEAGISCADRLLFCAKEATYKVWFPLTHRWLGFEEAEIDVRADGTLLAYPLIKPSPATVFEGRWYISEAYISVVMAMPAAGKRLRWPSC